MATNKMTPEQDRITREFYQLVVADEALFPGDTVGQGKAAQICRRLLNYVIVDGKHVSADSDLNYRFGTPVTAEDEWDEDTRKVMDAADQDTSTDEADSSVEAADSEVREAVLSEDV